MTTITRFTKEQLIEQVQEDVDTWRAAAEQFSPHPAQMEYAAIRLRVAEIALASLEAEAVCVIDQSNLDYLKSGSDADVWPASRTEMGDVLLYRAVPQPLASVPDEVSWEDVPEEITEEDMALASAWAHGFNQCRAAMLQGADGNSQVIPDGLRLALSNAGIAAPESDEMLYATHEKYVQMLVDWAKDRKPFKSVVIPDAYDIESFGIFSATEGENGLILQIELFRFGSEKCPKIGKENMVPKFALQGVINRLQNHCDSMGNETLVNILSTPAAPQQEV